MKYEFELASPSDRVKSPIIKGVFTSEYIFGAAFASMFVPDRWELYDVAKKPLLPDFQRPLTYFVNNRIVLYPLTKQSDITMEKVPDPGKLGIWIFTNMDGAPDETNLYLYSLIQSDNLDQFIKGFTAVFNKYKIDYRNYFYTGPIDHEGREYNINAFVKEPLFNRIDEDTYKKYQKQERKLMDLQDRRGNIEMKMENLERKFAKYLAEKNELDGKIQTIQDEIDRIENPIGQNIKRAN